MEKKVIQKACICEKFNSIFSVVLLLNCPRIFFSFVVKLVLAPVHLLPCPDQRVTLVAMIALHFFQCVVSSVASDGTWEIAYSHMLHFFLHDSAYQGFDHLATLDNPTRRLVRDCWTLIWGWFLLLIARSVIGQAWLDHTLLYVYSDRYGIYIDRYFTVY